VHVISGQNLCRRRYGGALWGVSQECSHGKGVCVLASAVY